MKKLLLILCISYNCFAMEQVQKDEEPVSPVFGSQRKQVKEIDEVFTPVETKKEESEITDVPFEKTMTFDVNDPEVQEVIKKVVSASIKEAFHNKHLEEQLARSKRCCNSSTKLKIALITAATTSVTGIITIILNLK